MTGSRSSRSHGWSPVRHAWRSAWGHRRGQAVALVAISTLITACTAFAPVYDRAMQQALVDTLLAQATPAEASVTLVSESSDFAGGAIDSRDPREVAALIPDDVAARLGPVVLGRTAIVTPTTGEVPPAGLLLWRDGACEHVRLLSGSCPDATGEILVSEADVENFGLRPGADRVVNPVYVDEQQPAVRLEVVGTYAPRNDVGDEDWWQGQRTVGFSSITRGLEPSANHDAWLTVEQTFVDAPILTGETSQAGAPVDTTDGDVDSLTALGEGVQQIAGAMDLRGADLELRTGVDELTDDLRAQVAQAHRTVPLLLAPMAVLSLFVLWLVLSAATSARRGEVAVARLRGRGPAGAAALLLLELLPALLLGVVPGAMVALAGGEVVRRLLPGESTFEAGPGFAAAVLLALVAVVLTTLAAAVRTAREPLHDVVRSGPVASAPWAFGAVEAFVVASVGTGVVAFASGSLQGPLALAGPALTALLTGLLLAHLVGPAGRALGRRLLGRGWLVSGTSLLETGRRSEGRTVIVVVTVACALATFSMDALTIGERNRSTASQHEAGAPAVAGVAGGDLDAVRAALAEADPTGSRATPVLVGRDTLAVDPVGFRRIAFFPRESPTAEEWGAIAPPEDQPVEITGSRVALDVWSDGLTADDIFGSEVDVRLSVVVTSATGVRRAATLGFLPSDGARRRLSGTLDACEEGCRLAALQLATAQGANIRGELELADLRVDGRPVDWVSSASDWNTTQDEDTLIEPVAGSEGAVRFAIDASGFYPVEVSPAWVPATVPTLLTDDHPDSDGEPLAVQGSDGIERPAEEVGRVVLLPAMPDGSALVDLDGVTRGAAITRDSRIEIWMDDDPDVEAAVRSALEGRDLALGDVRRYTDVRRTYDDTVASWSLALGAAVAPAVMLLALLVLLVLAAIGWRTRARDLAVLRLNGVDRRTTRRLGVWARLPAVLVGVVGGVLAGLGGAVLAMPDVAFLPEAPEVPVLDVSTSWAAVVAVAGVCLVLLPVVAALTGLVVARRAHVERVREGG
jgi:putative ABC transport system permease protein